MDEILTGRTYEGFDPFFNNNNSNNSNSNNNNNNN
jgi:hypothetical protein